MSIAEDIKPKPAAPAKKVKRIPSRVYVDIREMIDPVTGEMVGCLVPAGQTDRDILRRKKCRVGMRIRTTVSKERSYGQHKYAHRLGQLFEQAIEKFAGKDPHVIVKELQVEADAFCDHEKLQIPGYDGFLIRKVARSIAYDEMEETDFVSLVKQICNYVGREYLAGLSEDKVMELVEAMPEET